MLYIVRKVIKFDIFYISETFSVSAKVLDQERKQVREKRVNFLNFSFTQNWLKIRKNL